MSKKTARENAFKLVFEYLFNKDVRADGLPAVFDEETPPADRAFAEQILNGVKQNYDELKQLISQNAKDYAYDRIYKVDLAILLAALTEILYIKGEKALVINEAVELAKIYSTEKSYKFINGVLAGIVNKGEVT